MGAAIPAGAGPLTHRWRPRPREPTRSGGQATATLALRRVGVSHDERELARLHRVLAVERLYGDGARLRRGEAHECAAALSLLLREGEQCAQRSPQTSLRAGWCGRAADLACENVHVLHVAVVAEK